MDIRAEEITAIIEKQLKQYEREIREEDVGTVLEVGDGVATIYGLDDAMAGELLDFGNGVYGMVMNLREDSVGAAVFGSGEMVKENDLVKRTGRVVEVPVGKSLCGRIVNALPRRRSCAP